MKIAIMGGWNVGSGASVHSELIGREFVKNNALEVFTFYKTGFHGLCVTKDDEEFITRCFTKYGDENPKLNQELFLKEAHDVFIVEDLGMLPMDKLKEIFLKIKKRSKTINVIHDGKISNKSEFYDFDFDAIVCFDERYKEFLKKKYPEEKIHLIQYPSLKLNPGNKEKAREKLKLPKDKKIIFSFGRLAYYMDSEIELINELSDKYDILFLVVTTNKKILNKINKMIKKGKVKFKIETRKEDPNLDELYEYLHASDVLIFPKQSSLHVVVPSTIFQTLGSLCPIVARDSNFVEMFSNEIWKYRNYQEFNSSLEKAFNQGKDYEKLKKAIKKYLEKYSSIQIAEMFQDLFKKLGVKNGTKEES